MKKNVNVKHHFVGRSILIVVLLVICAIAVSTALGKYATVKEFEGVFFGGDKLADTFMLLEHTAVVQEDGSYELSNELTVTNTYKLIPGTTIPKDPFISITGKTATEAYLYLEVVEDESVGISYTLSSDWSLLSGVTGPHGGAVYTYASGVLDGTSEDLEISILDGDGFVLDKTPLTDSDVLNFCGFLIQATDDDANAAAAFNRVFA